MVSLISLQGWVIFRGSCVQSEIAYCLHKIGALKINNKKQKNKTSIPYLVQSYVCRKCFNLFESLKLFG